MTRGRGGAHAPAPGGRGPRGSEDGPPPRPRDGQSLGFQRKPMVQWFDPAILLDAGLRVVLSSVFGAYSDKRETQAAIEAPIHDYGPGDDGALWIDFVADLGDGFDSTYAVASLLGRKRLRLAGDGSELPRGRVLVMGGDQVYPSPTREDYENRFRGPYAAALPWAPPGSGPDLFAIPGNHDWYDGLTNFVRFFCAGRRIGGWQTRQRRSYFALSLPHRWWLLALDIQLDTYIDDPQMAYFRAAGLEPGDRVILVTGKPSWVKVKAPREAPESYKNLRYFKDEVVRRAGARVKVTLTGDLHHYCRYESEDGSQLVTAGGGGAYLFPTHTMPAELLLPDEPGPYRQKAETCWPGHEPSRKMARGALRMPLLAPGLCLIIAVLHASFAAALFAALDGGSGVPAALIGLATLAALFGYAAFETPLAKLAAGSAHAALQLALPVLIAWLAAGPFDASGGWGTVAVGVVAGAIGYVAGGVFFGAYLLASHRKAPKHANEVFSCQAIPDFKSFLRLRLDERGLTIYPIGLERTPREWALAKGGAADPWLKPADGPLEATLIEPPISVPAVRA